MHWVIYQVTFPPLSLWSYTELVLRCVQILAHGLKKKSTVYFKSIMFMQESKLLMLILLYLESENRVFRCFWCLGEMRRIQ